jgi:hypothetical protein
MWPYSFSLLHVVHILGVPTLQLPVLQKKVGLQDHLLKVYLWAINATIDYKPMLKCLIFGLFWYFHPTTCFDVIKIIFFKLV